MIFPFLSFWGLISEFLSTPTTFSPMTTGIPTNAPPIAKAFQYFSAIKVDPIAPVINGILIFVFFFLPKEVFRFTLGKIQSSGSWVISPVIPVDP